ncbi:MULTISPECIES: DUF2442 domain-containing protein [Marinomonas]|uniref:DUF2442 domain-containing protein n=1 Tax=Marinomonas arctica TaxID=383750 RepID=A0A7H1JAU2_9GAMM|nr:MULTISPECIES: DUF2442 domain-containing protein [Marinomonas]MCS7486882.1 hypothetical protein [Marinomonas sp. BSi20414]QNT07608.1 DUF2442 domain-containing protein [Marinomonas arctica]GGN21210.1 molybdopterin-guanine dinucleotide biosynthesis protein MobA [Marinomonas arctica]
MLHITSAKYLSGYKLWIAFDDGTSGEVDLANELKGSMFEPLKDLAEFQNVSVDPELETIVWPNGADLAPEFLKALQSKQSV